MIKIEINPSGTESSAFPVIKKNKEYGFLVAFTDKQTGFVVSDTLGGYKFGEFSKSWLPYDDDEWEHFQGEIIIKQ